MPPGRLAAVLEPRAATPAPLDALVQDALDAPVGAAALRDLARGARRVLVIVDDATRGTPARRILPHVARELSEAAVRDEQVTVLTHVGPLPTGRGGWGRAPFTPGERGGRGASPPNASPARRRAPRRARSPRRR